MAMYNKIFAKILDSSIWLEDVNTRIVWVTFLAAMDQDGYAHFSAIANLANRARVPTKDAEKAVKTLSEPDPDSADPEHDGRRIERVPGGFLILNAEKYRGIVTRIVQREQTKKRVAKHRANKCNATVTHSNDSVTPSEANTKAEANTKDQERSQNSKRVSTVPFEEILNLYHESLPELPRCLKLTKTRKAHIRQRWLEDFPDMDAWKTFFGYVKKSRFLTGKSNNGRPFRATLDWLIKAENCVKVVEGKYE